MNIKKTGIKFFAATVAVAAMAAASPAFADVTYETHDNGQYTKIDKFDGNYSFDGATANRTHYGFYHISPDSPDFWKYITINVNRGAEGVDTGSSSYYQPFVSFHPVATDADFVVSVPKIFDKAKLNEGFYKTDAPDHKDVDAKDPGASGQIPYYSISTPSISDAFTTYAEGSEEFNQVWKDAVDSCKSDATCEAEVNKAKDNSQAILVKKDVPAQEAWTVKYDGYFDGRNLPIHTFAMVKTKGEPNNTVFYEYVDTIRPYTKAEVSEQLKQFDNMADLTDAQRTAFKDQFTEANKKNASTDTVVTTAKALNDANKALKDEVLKAEEIQKSDNYKKASSDKKQAVDEALVASKQQVDPTTGVQSVDDVNAKTTALENALTALDGDANALAAAKKDAEEKINKLNISLTDQQRADALKKVDEAANIADVDDALLSAKKQAGQNAIEHLFDLSDKSDESPRVGTGKLPVVDDSNPGKKDAKDRSKESENKPVKPSKHQKHVAKNAKQVSSDKKQAVDEALAVTGADVQLLFAVAVIMLVAGSILLVRKKRA